MADSEKCVDPVKALYPYVDEKETPLPRSWSPKDKYNYIGLSQNNLRVHYKGHGKTHKDAASVRATNPIPPACGLYYFEVKIISKGRDGYMGIGLSAQGVNMNRLPGWDKHSYGYHGDDGHSFCSSGTGQPYGPTFTTGDVIGCGVNMIDNTAFYTKNGHNLGTAFTDLPPNLYPTVGLQTPGEVVDANFGQSPFVFDIREMMDELKARIRNNIYTYEIPESHGQWQIILQKMVSTYLVHHGYCATAEAFARGTGQAFDEEITSIKNRQKILKLVLNGKMEEAIETTTQLYPGLLEHNRNLLFMLKCRQFVEMVNGTEHDEVTASTTQTHKPYVSSPRPSVSPQPTSVIQSTKSLNANNVNTCNKSTNVHHHDLVEEMTTSTISNGTTNGVKNGVCEEEEDEDDDVEMTTSLPEEKRAAVPASVIVGVTNGVTTVHNRNAALPTNGYHSIDHGSVEDMDIDPAPVSNATVIMSPSVPSPDAAVIASSSSPASPQPVDKKLCGGDKTAIERMLEFGRELFLLSVQLRQECGKNEANKEMLRNAFSLLAYSNPWTSPVGWQLDPIQRESVCAKLNSAILESSNLARRPPLEVAVAHTTELIALMPYAGLGSCAFVNFDDLLRN